MTLKQCGLNVVMSKSLPKQETIYRIFCRRCDDVQSRRCTDSERRRVTFHGSDVIRWTTGEERLSGVHSEKKNAENSFTNAFFVISPSHMHHNIRHLCSLPVFKNVACFFYSCKSQFSAWISVFWILLVIFCFTSLKHMLFFKSCSLKNLKLVIEKLAHTSN